MTYQDNGKDFGLVAKFNNMEEVKAAKRQANRPLEKDYRQLDRGSGKENRPLKLRFQNYIPLNTFFRKIMDDIQTLELLKPIERKILAIKLLNSKKYCKYH